MRRSMARRRKRLIRGTIPGHSARQENSWPQIPGLKKYEISTGEVGAPAGPSGIHLVATPYFDSLDAKAGLASPQGQAAAGDLANFADGCAELYFFDKKDV
jgi:uncharacterized protein (TIGR02118 family)